MIICGIPIPLQYITPKLDFYPLILPSNIILINNNSNNNNNNNNKNFLNEKNHLDFVKTLMKYLKINYIIIGDYLIDTTRRDFQVSIDQYSNVSISNYQNNNNVTFINDKYFTKNIKKLNLDYDTNKYYNCYNNYNNISEFIHYHCQRISRNTLKIKFFFSNYNLKKVTNNNNNNNKTTIH